MTPQDHLEGAIAELRELAKENQELVPQVLVERDDGVIAIALNVNPASIGYAAPVLLGVFNADSVTAVIDTYLYRPPVPGVELNKKRSKELFEAGAPGAFEGLLVEQITADTITLLERPYTRGSKGITLDGDPAVIEITHTDTTVFAAGGFLVVPKDLKHGQENGRKMREKLVQFGVSEAAMDSVVTALLGSLLECTMMCMVPFVDADGLAGNEYRRWCDQLGLDVQTFPVDPQAN